MSFELSLERKKLLILENELAVCFENDREEFVDINGIEPEEAFQNYYNFIQRATKEEIQTEFNAKGVEYVLDTYLVDKRTNEELEALIKNKLM